MRKTKSALLAASTILLAVAVTGCAMGEKRSSFGGVSENSNIGVALRAQAALEQGDSANAIRFAERAVDNSPTDAGFRALLGNAYMSSGRFRSAEAAYADALSLIPSLPGVPLKLALTQAGQGKGDAAVTTLEAYSQAIDPADAGLAMALAGRPGAAVELLDQAARAPGADARVRQNLALAHALAGDWVRARTVAAQDLAGDQLEKRMSDWASFARPGASGSQVASLIGVTAPVAADPGQPVRLALRRERNDVRTAEAEVPAPVAAAEPVMASAAAAPAVAIVAPAPSLPSPIAEPMPIEVAAASEPAAEVATAPDVAEMVDSLRAERVQADGRLPKVAELRRAAVRRFGRSQAVVQLGAYATEAGLKMGWSVVAKRHKGVRSYVPASARFNGPRGTVYRLSLKGFASDSEARQLCMQLKAGGASCFVRSAAGDSPVRFASR
ncbi:SPOR domain-containing protein [Sphingomonas sp. LHG3406-1]|uniref:SPOR domain-containing protein n=1 Tax=Sphingomonas sp. LHG3406-1 TaxID=2804617 RepID=UPI002615AC88|nr:SPOR domain-containing protein [Sphingomonas sp. LHG3406-1]